jgi:hypothetical protein
MVAAVLACAVGHAEGAALSRRIGGTRVICWALVLSLPLVLPGVLWRWPDAPGSVT